MPHRILIVDDDPATRDAMAELLAERHEVITASDGAAALGVLDRLVPDLVVTDLAMPSLGGFGFITALRQTLPYIPVLIVSGHSDTQHRVDGFRLGADDFLPKPVDCAELVVRIERHLQRSRLQQEMLQLSVSDELTGMLNRRGIANMFARDATARAQGLPTSVLLADLDDFKAVNDRYGHAVGDLALCAISRMLQDAVRASDRVGRLGGDEFVIVLPGMDGDALSQLIDRLRTKHLPLELVLTDHDRLKICCSIGGATAYGEETLDSVLARADQAMYRQKQQKGPARHAAWASAR